MTAPEKTYLLTFHSPLQVHMSMLGISRLKTRIGSTMTTSRYDTESPSNSPQPSPIQAPADANMQHEKAEAPRLHSRTTCSRNYDAPLRSTEVDNKLAASALPPASTVTPYGAPARANRPRAVSPDQRPEFLTGMIGLMNSIQVKLQLSRQSGPHRSTPEKLIPLLLFFCRMCLPGSHQMPVWTWISPRCGEEEPPGCRSALLPGCLSLASLPALFLMDTVAVLAAGRGHWFAEQWQV